MEVSESEANAIVGLSPVSLNRTNTCNVNGCSVHPVFCEGDPVSRWKAAAAAVDENSQHGGCTPSTGHSPPSLRGIIPPCLAWNCHPPEESVIPSRREICDVWKFITTGDISLSALTVYGTASTTDGSVPVAAARRGLQQDDDETDSSSITTESGIQGKISSILIPNPHSTPLSIEIRERHKAVTGEDEEAPDETTAVPDTLSTGIHWEQALSKFRLSQEEDFVQRMKKEFRRRREEDKKTKEDNGQSEKEALRKRIKDTLYKIRTKGLKRKILQELEEKSALNQDTMMENSPMNDESIETDESRPAEEPTQPDPMSDDPLVSEKDVTTTDAFVEEQDHDIVDPSGFVTSDVDNNGTAASSGDDDDFPGAFDVSVSTKSVRFSEEVQVRTPSSSVDSIASSGMEGRQPSDADSASDSIRAVNSEEESSKWWMEDDYTNGGTKRDAVGVSTTGAWDMDSIDTVEWLSPTKMGMLEEKPLLGLRRPESPRSWALRKNRRNARLRSLSPAPQVQHIQEKLLLLHCGANKAHQRLLS
jgi:hypothetical protein